MWCEKGAGELLAEAAALGVEVRAEGDRLVIRGPRSAEALGREILARKAEVLALLQGEGTAEAVPVPEPSAPEPVAAEWDPVSVGVLLAGCNARLDAALLEDGIANNVKRKELVELFREIVGDRARKRDPVFWISLQELESKFRWWRDLDEQKAQSPPLPPAIVPVVSRSARRRKGTDA